MYFVDREKIEVVLIFLEKQLALFGQVKTFESPIEKACLERIAHTAAEAVLDVGNSLIDGFIMRDPGSYEDIIDILTDEKVVSDEAGIGLKKIISYRKKLVQQYDEINHDELFTVFSEQLPILNHFAPKVRTYLQNELGPVSAFKN